MTTTKSYYENLFSSKNIKKYDITNYLNNININHILTPEEANLCENEISEEESKNVIMNIIKSNKTPGYDGISLEFYHTFWDIIKNPILESFRNAFKKDELAFSHRESVITLVLLL